MKRDHSSALEALAAEHCRSPLDVLEWFLERAAIREFCGGMSREHAEREALRDITAELSGVPVASVSRPGSGSAVPQMQSSSTSNPVAKQSVSRGEQ